MGADPPRQCPARRAGMTLIEVLLAVVILGTALGALVEAASRSLAVVRQARNYETARRMLGEVDAENPLWLKDEIAPGHESGGFTGGPSGWRWSRAVQHLGDADEDKEGLFIVTTRVIWSHGNNQGREEISQYLFVPKNVDGKYSLKPKTR